MFPLFTSCILPYHIQTHSPCPHPGATSPQIHVNWSDTDPTLLCVISIWHESPVYAFRVTNEKLSKAPMPAMLTHLAQLWFTWSPMVSTENSIMEIRWPTDHPIFTKGFTILIRWHLYIEAGPRKVSLPFTQPMITNHFSAPRQAHCEVSYPHHNEVSYLSRNRFINASEMAINDRNSSAHSKVIIEFAWDSQSGHEDSMFREQVMQRTPNINGLVQGCSNSSTSAMELLQSCTKPSI